jgi:acetyl-CoA carboxylase beta subunit
MSSGVIPQISLILGPCAGGAVYSPALTDFVIMGSDSFMFLTGPDVIKATTGEDVTAQTLGGADVHMGRSGNVHLATETEAAAIELVKHLLGYLPQNNNEDPPQLTPYDPTDRMDEALNTLIPHAENEPYDIRDAVAMIFDRQSFLEIQPEFAPNAVVGFARLDGFSVGVIANQPAYMSGALNIDASDKISRFIRTCDAYNIPLVTFIDCPGFLPGTDQEYGGVIRHGAKIIYAYCEATVPKISLVTRKAMGGAYVAMCSKQMRTDLAFAWPTAQIAVMGAEPAVRVLFREEVQRASDPAAKERELIAYYREQFYNPYRAADVGQIDEVIEPRETRPRLVRATEPAQEARALSLLRARAGARRRGEDIDGKSRLGPTDDSRRHGPRVLVARAALGLAASRAEARQGAGRTGVGRSIDRQRGEDCRGGRRRNRRAGAGDADGAGHGCRSRRRHHGCNADAPRGATQGSGADDAQHVAGQSALRAEATDATLSTRHPRARIPDRRRRARGESLLRHRRRRDV